MSKCTDHLENVQTALSKPTKSEVRVLNIFEKQKKKKKPVSVLKEKK